MNIEESVTYIKEKIKNKLPEYTETFVDGKSYRIDVLQLETRWTEKTAEAIETLLTAYEKEKEKNKELSNSYDKLAKECNEEKEKIKNFKIEDERIFIQFGKIIEKKMWKNKIKAKLEEVDYKMVAHQDVREAVKQVLQSLLEKE